MKKQLLLCFSIVVFSMLLIACSENIMDKKITKDNMEEELKEIANSKKLTVQDRKLIASYIIRSEFASTFGNESQLENKTI